MYRKEGNSIYILRQLCKIDFKEQEIQKESDTFIV